MNEKELKLLGLLEDKIEEILKTIRNFSGILGFSTRGKTMELVDGIVEMLEEVLENDLEEIEPLIKKWKDTFQIKGNCLYYNN